MTKQPIHREDITILSTYELNIRASKYIKEELSDLKAEIDSNAIMTRDFSTPLSAMDCPKILIREKWT